MNDILILLCHYRTWKVEGVLEADIERIVCGDDAIEITVKMDDFCVQGMVNATESVGSAVKRLLNSPDEMVLVTQGGMDVDVTESFEANGIEEDATLSVHFDRGGETFIATLLELNPGMQRQNVVGTRGNFRLELNGDRSLHSWNLSSLLGPPTYERTVESLRIPEAIVDLELSGDLNLSDNIFDQLPEYVGHVSVGGKLSFFRCNLRTIPDSFGSMSVTLYPNQSTTPSP